MINKNEKTLNQINDNLSNANNPVNNYDDNNYDDNNKIVLNGKIYKIINLIINEPCYIGQTISSIKHRFNEHCSLSNNQNTSYLINTYGRQYFKIELIKDNISTKQELDIIEREYIISYLQQYDLINKVIYKNYEKTSITIQCIETGEIFPSINTAAKRYNIHINSISQAIQYGYAVDINQSKINNSNENNNKNSSGNNDNINNSDNNNEFLNSQSEVTKLHWKRLDSDDTYQKRIQNEYIIYIIEQKFKISNNTSINADININTNININEKNTDQIISTSQKFKSNAFCIQCIETLEIFSSINKAAKKYNINSNLVNKSIKYGYAAGIDQNGNKLHWKKITNEQYSNILKSNKYNEAQYIWKPIYIQQTWKKIWTEQLKFHKNNANSPLYQLLNNNDINDFRLISVQESSLAIIKENIKKFVNIKSLNDAIEKEKQLISLLISNSYKLYNFYNNPNYSINDNTDETIVIDINEMLKNYQQEQNQLEQKLLCNDQEVDIKYKPMQVQCIETKEIFNNVYEAIKKYNIALYAINKAILYGYFAGKYNGQQLHWKEYNEIILNANNDYQLYIIEQNMQNIEINTNDIIVYCIETNEIFKDINQAAQKYNTEMQNIYVAMRYGYTTGTDQNGNKLHWININYPIYKTITDKNDNWIPICIVCERKFTNTYKQNNIEILNKLKKDINCDIYNLLNQYPLTDFRLAKVKKYQFALDNIIINKPKKQLGKYIIRCIETNEIFDGISPIEKKYNIDHRRIQSAIKTGRAIGKDNNGNKLHWEIIDNNQEKVYNYFKNSFKNINNINDIFERAQFNLAKYYNLYGKQLTPQNLISNKIFNNIDIIAWNLIKNNPYLNTSELCKSINDNIIFLNHQSAAQYYNMFLQKMKNIINNNEEFIYNKAKQKIINISINELNDNTIIYAIAYQIIKININNNITYTITYNSFTKFKAQLDAKNRINSGICKFINNDNIINECSIIKSHIYFKEEAENLKSALLNKKPSVFKCKLPVRCITTGEEFASIEEVSKKYGYKSETNILYVCRGQREYTINQQTREKLKWEFLQEEKGYIPMDRNQKKYTVFLLYYNNELIIISKSTLFKNKQLSPSNKTKIIHGLKTYNLLAKNIFNNVSKDELKFIVHSDNLSFDQAQQLINKLKIQYAAEGHSLLNSLCK